MWPLWGVSRRCLAFPVCYGNIVPTKPFIFMPAKVHSFLCVLDLLGKHHKGPAYGWITQVNITCRLRRYGRCLAVGCGLHKLTWWIQSISCVHWASLTWLVHGELQTWPRVFKTFWCGPTWCFYVLNRRKEWGQAEITAAGQVHKWLKYHLSGVIINDSLSNQKDVVSEVPQGYGWGQRDSVLSLTTWMRVIVWIE